MQQKFGRFYSMSLLFVAWMSTDGSRDATNLNLMDYNHRSKLILANINRQTPRNCTYVGKPFVIKAAEFRGVTRNIVEAVG